MARLPDGKTIKLWAVRTAMLAIAPIALYAMLSGGVVSMVVGFVVWSIWLASLALVIGGMAVERYGKHKTPDELTAERQARLDAANERFRNAILDMVQQEFERGGSRYDPTR